jgi:Cu/Ag efflux protein CusF
LAAVSLSVNESHGVRKNLLRLKRVVTGFLLITVVSRSAGPAAVKEFTLFARVESVDKATKAVTVKHAKIAGYVEAVPAIYGFDDETLVNKLRPGDDIKATVRDGEHRLRNVRIVNRPPSRLSTPAK